MLHVKLFENFDNKELLNTIKDCFQSLIDDYICEIYDASDDSIHIYCEVTKPMSQSRSFDSYFLTKRGEYDSLLEIHNCLNRVKMAYGEDIDINWNSEKDNDFTISISEGAPIVGDYWKIGKDNIVRIDYDQLKKILDIPKDIYISQSSNGKNSLLSFNFKDVSQLNEYADSLIDEFMKLKIKDEFFVGDHVWSVGTSGNDVSKYKIDKNYREGNNGGGYKTRNRISFGMNDKFQYHW